MSANLIDDVLEPVCQALQSECDYLTKRNKPRIKRQVPKGNIERGMESWFQKSVVLPAVRPMGHDISEHGNGPDLVFRDGMSKLILELKGANSFQVSYYTGMKKSYHGWVLKYLNDLNYRNLDGCLFLASEPDDASMQYKLDQVANYPAHKDHGIRLAGHRIFYDHDGCPWIVGLFVTPIGERYLDGPQAKIEENSIECHMCGGDVEPTSVTKTHWLDGHPYVVENVEAQICTQCGERSFDPSTLDELNDQLRQGAAVRKTMQVEVVSL